MLYVTGYKSNIVKELVRLCFDNIERLPGDYSKLNEPLHEMSSLSGLRYLFCAGILYSESIVNQTNKEIIESLSINLINTIVACEIILANNSQARIIIMGSESAKYGSYDMTYACSKAGLECYVKTKKLKPNQQLLCISPHIIIDAGMTTKRDDLENLNQRAQEHPKERWITSMEVAKTIYHYLYVDEGYTTGQVIRMNGGLK